jgi:hypothetical protein
MTLPELISEIGHFDNLSSYEKIILFAWYVHTHEGREVFDNAVMRECFKALHLPAPDMSVYLPRMVAKKPPQLLRGRIGYRLAGPLRRAFDEKYGEARVAPITSLLRDLPDKVSDLSERGFLLETIQCYRVGAFRAATVMAWNLAFDHLLNWLIGDVERLKRLNGGISTKFPKKQALAISRREDMEELKEAEVVEICRTSRLLSRDVVGILREKLNRRNISAHPSSVIVTQGQADDTISDLVNNVILRLE